MKKYFLSLTIVLSVFSFGMLGMLHAGTVESMQAGRPAKTGEPRLEVQAGVAAAVQGEVKATTPPEKASHPLKSGDKIFMGDKIETGAGSQIQILLQDETMFTLGPLSTITVDEFIYDPKNAGDKASMVKGVFRAVSGKVARKKQENAAETEDLLNAMDKMDQASREAAQDRTQRSTGNAQR